MENKDDNMDLDSLKTLWNRDMEQQATAMGYSQQKILEVMQQKSSSSLQRIKRNLWVEILVTIPLFPVLYFVLENREIHLPVWAWALFILMTFGYHVYLLFKLPKKERSAESNLLTGIQENIGELRGFIGMYDKFAWVFALMIGGAVASIGISFHAQIEHSPQNSLLYTLLLLLGIFAGIGAFVSVKWYVNKLYGQHYKTLLDCQQTLESA